MTDSVYWHTLSMESMHFLKVGKTPPKHFSAVFVSLDGEKQSFVLLWKNNE